MIEADRADYDRVKLDHDLIVSITSGIPLALLFKSTWCTIPTRPSPKSKAYPDLHPCGTALLLQPPQFLLTRPDEHLTLHPSTLFLSCVRKCKDMLLLLTFQ